MVRYPHRQLFAPALALLITKLTGVSADFMPLYFVLTFDVSCVHDNTCIDNLFCVAAYIIIYYDNLTALVFVFFFAF